MVVHAAVTGALRLARQQPSRADAHIRCDTSPAVPQEIAFPFPRLALPVNENLLFGILADDPLGSLDERVAAVGVRRVRIVRQRDGLARHGLDERGHHVAQGIVFLGLRAVGPEGFRGVQVEALRAGAIETRRANWLPRLMFMHWARIASPCVG